METRIGNIIIGSSGGTAGGTANNYKIALPSSWVRQMGISPDSRQVELSFDGTTITIARKQSLQEFLEANRHAGHKLYLLCCYSGDTLCAKIAAESYDDRVDPVGACVGVKGSRIHGIVRELRNENIDVIPFTTNPSLFIQRALSPAI